MDEKQILMDRAYEKLEVAKSLLENGFFSDAVSRAYYVEFVGYLFTNLEKNHGNTKYGMPIRHFEARVRCTS